MRTNLVVATMLLLTAACATKQVPPAPTSLAHPEFLYPSVPALLQKTFSAQHVDLGWRYLQIDDLRGADREFAAAPDTASLHWRGATSIGQSPPSMRRSPHQHRMFPRSSAAARPCSRWAEKRTLSHCSKRHSNWTRR